MSVERFLSMFIPAFSGPMAPSGGSPLTRYGSWDDTTEIFYDPDTDVHSDALPIRCPLILVPFNEDGEAAAEKTLWYCICGGHYT